jgi:hypothetical protein
LPDFPGLEDGEEFALLGQDELGTSVFENALKDQIARQVGDTSAGASDHVRRLRRLPTPDEGSSVTYASSRRAAAVNGLHYPAGDLEPGSGGGPALRLHGQARP